MPLLFTTVGLIGKQDDPAPMQTLVKLSRFLLKRGHRVLLEEATDQPPSNHGLETISLDEIGRRCDLAIIVGGDGTLLHAARGLASRHVPLLGVNLGRLGFLTDVSPDSMLPTLEQILSGHYSEERRCLLQAEINGCRCTALNDVVIHKWNIARMIEFETFVDGSSIDVQRSDGLIISTPTGSTAYALSGGGPLLHPTLNATVLVPICPHTLSNRPIVVSGDSVIKIQVSGHTELDHVRVTCDGQTCIPVTQQTIRISKYAHPVHLIHPKGHEHFDILRAKLGWGEHPLKPDPA